MKDHLPILMALFPLAGAGLALGLGIFSYRLSRWATYGVLALTFYFTCLSFPRLFSEGSWHYSLGGWAPPWGIELVVTPFSAFLACFILLVAWFSFYYLGSFGLMAGLLKSRESLGGSLLLVLVSALLTQLWVRDGFTLYLFLEISIVAAAALFICVARQGWLEGFTWLLGGSLGASFLLAGFLFLYSVTGSLHMDDLLAQLFITKNFSMALAAGFFLTAAWAFLFCFPSPHFFARLLDQIPPFLLGFFSSVLVRTAVYLLFLILFFILNVPGLGQPAGFVAVEYLLALFFLVDFVFASRQKDFLHSVAFLSVAQLAFPLIGFVGGNKSALTGSLMEILSQVLVVMGLFTAVGILSPKPTGAHPLSKLAGLGRHDFSLALCLVIFTFSIVGIPPTGGSFGKFYLLQGLFEKRDWFLLVPLSGALLFNLVTAARFLWLLFEQRRAASFHMPLSFASKTPLFLLALAVLLLGIFHQEIVHSLIEPALPKAYQNIPLPNVPFLGKQVE
ncbi:MAG TPA: proton-conducting transporter membrane subunit [bacterium]|nr:proton-conducting transporter membrane subunit [bacterium]